MQASPRTMSATSRHTAPRRRSVTRSSSSHCAGSSRPAPARANACSARSSPTSVTPTPRPGSPVSSRPRWPPSGRRFRLRCTSSRRTRRLIWPAPRSRCAQRPGRGRAAHRASQALARSVWAETTRTSCSRRPTAVRPPGQRAPGRRSCCRRGPKRNCGNCVRQWPAACDGGPT